MIERLFLIFGASIILFLTIEVTLRIFSPPQLIAEGDVFRWSDNLKKRFELTPGAEGEIANVGVKINRFGCRDREVQDWPSEGVTRIVSLGDSLAFGYGIENDKTYVRQMEDRLVKDHLKVQTINCGVFSYNIAEIKARFYEIIAQLHPQIIIITYELGDILINPSRQYTSDPEAGSNDSSEKVNQQLAIGDTTRKILKNSYVLRFIVYHYSFLMKALGLRTWDRIYTDESYQWKQLKTNYEEMTAYAREKNIKLLVVLVPELSNLDPDQYPWQFSHDQIRNLMNELDVTFVDMLPYFYGYDEPRLWIHPFDRHPNERANRMMADAVFPTINQLVHEVRGLK